jgi:S-adenosylmethionine uptake transporter
LLLPFVLRQRQGFHIDRPWLHVARGVLIATATVFFFSALKYLPLADTIAIFFVEPLILTLLSAVFLKETIGWRRVTAVLVGFVGALIVIRPGYAVFGPVALLPLCAALSFACYMILTRTLAQVQSAVSMQFYAGIFGVLVMTAALIFGNSISFEVLTPVWPTTQEWLLLSLLGAIATTGHMFVVNAMRLAPANVLAPFQYLEIISATILGFIFFNDFPDPTTWLGVAIIVGSGVFVYYRERLTARAQPT